MVSNINTHGYSRVNMHDGSIVSNPIENEINIFHSLGSGGLENEYNKIKTYDDKDYMTPREEFEKILSEQGVIGRSIDNLKNKIPLFSLIGWRGSNEVEKTLEKYENGGIFEFEARNVVYEYRRNQKILTDFVLNALMLAFGTIGFLIMNFLDVGTGTKLAFTMLLSGGMRYCVEKLEKFTCKLSREYCAKNNLTQKNFNPF